MSQMQDTQACTQLSDFAKAQGYVGIDYEPDFYDCAHLFIQVQREVFGRDIDVPTRFASHRQGRAGQAAQIKEARDSLATRVEGPEHGCAVLLVGAGDVWHIGTVFMRHGEA